MATATQKKSNAARLGVLAVALSLVTACLLGGTMAKYVTEVTGTGSATVAKWSFKANNETTTFADINIASTAYTNINNADKNRIAPGTAGSFDIMLDATGSDVAVGYTIAFTNLSNQPTNLKFYSDKEMTQEITNLSTGLTGAIDYNATADAMKTTKTVYWKWDYQTASGDTADVENAGKDMTFDIKVIGTRKEPVAPSA